MENLMLIIGATELWVGSDMIKEIPLTFLRG